MVLKSKNTIVDGADPAKSVSAKPAPAKPASAKPAPAKSVLAKPAPAASAPAANSAPAEQNSAAEQGQSTKSPTPRRRFPGWLRFGLSLLLLCAGAVFFTYYFLAATNMNDAVTIDEFIAAKPDLFCYSLLIVFFLIAVLAALTWRPVLSLGIIFSLLTIVAYVNTEKFALRGAPFLPEELKLADQVGGLMEFVDFGSVLRLLGLVVLVVAGSAILQALLRKFLGRPRRTLVPRLAATAISLTGLILLASPIIRQESLTLLPNLEYVGWNQTWNYNDNGFIIGFLYNLGNLELEPPSDYSESTIADIAAKYQALQDADTNRQPLSDLVDNVIIILAETTYDPALYTEYLSHDGGDVLPNLHRLFQQYPSGYLYSTEYGGGTANVEFEVQTGLSNFWAQSMPYLNAIPRVSANFPSLANFAKSAGYQTTGLHAYDGSVYKRNLVYPIIGYDQFITQTEMTNQEHEGDSSYINERSTYQEILDLLAASDQPQFIGVATMQNHAPYWQANYPELNFTISDTADISDETRFTLESSFESLSRADQYLGDFIAALDQLDERTVVLWFGDHTIGLLDQYYGADDLELRALAQLTPYFVYANFPIESSYSTADVSAELARLGIGEITSSNGKTTTLTKLIRGIDLPTTSPNCLPNTLLDLLGAEKPALLYLTSAVCQITPVLAGSYWGDTVPPASQALTDYELVNYDLLAGKRYWLSL